MSSSPVLLVHGAASDSRCWDLVRRELPADLTVHAPDMTYAGNKPWPDKGERFGVRTQVLDIVRAASQIGEPVHLVCISLSCLAGLVALIRKPELFRSAFFYECNATSYVEDPSLLEQIAEDQRALMGPVVETMRRDGLIAALMPLTEGKRANWPPDRQAVGTDNAQTVRLMLGPYETANVPAETMRKIRVPSCFAMGSETRLMYSIPTRAGAKLVPNSSFVSLPGADHYVLEEDPALFAATLADWVESQ